MDTRLDGFAYIYGHLEQFAHDILDKKTKICYTGGSRTYKIL